MSIDTKEKKVVHKTKIDDDYYIDSDSYQYLLQKKTIAKSGKHAGDEVYTTEKYCGTISETLDQYTQIKLREKLKECDEIGEIKEHIKNLKDYIKIILGGM